ncbi:MAG: hypothetical protein AVDCRST_MAG91-1453 [uncultured Sphingomonadaceae bacterium]|uniref:Uncharacterized protein n=1 Tax=uncultured Sphingomonadaceae bacterium TaxID=169976 RepID=A0A6J4SX47_9SPHN|nr:MAG: hypothetical protein AVDCRST_MAG91-1453 [uncultured Sphingomonadaceae bacterium]
MPENFQITFRRDLLAETLWEYGEDDLAEAALRLSEDELRQVQILAVWHHENDPEPETGPQLLAGRIMARAMIEFAERTARDTKRVRRRTRPEHAGHLAGERSPDTPAEHGLNRHL